MQLDQTFAALADPTRRAILAMLLEDDMAVTDVAEPFAMSLAAISKHLGWHIEKRLQQRLREQFFGELLVGQATVVETDHQQFPYLIAAPTMRTPMTILRTPNIYLATKAIFTLWKYGTFDDGSPIREKIQSIAIPGLGTGVGQVPPLLCARQMRIAWEDVMHEKFKTEAGWQDLQKNYAYFFTQEEQDLYYDIP